MTSPKQTEPATASSGKNKPGETKNLAKLRVRKLDPNDVKSKRGLTKRPRCCHQPAQLFPDPWNWSTSLGSRPVKGPATGPRQTVWHPPTPQISRVTSSVLTLSLSSSRLHGIAGRPQYWHQHGQVPCQCLVLWCSNGPTAAHSFQ